MYQPLAVCPGCSRHVKTTERSCPFCKGALSAALADAALPGATTRLTRAAAFAFTASLAVVGTAAGTEACTSSTPDVVGDASTKDGGPTGEGGTTDGGPSDDGGAQALYGAVPVDSGPDDSGGTGAKYGGPPIDAGNG